MILGTLTRLEAEHAGETVLCVLHGGVIRAQLAHADGIHLGESPRGRAPCSIATNKAATHGHRGR
jgi:broad specificity phosphatase PhoE